MASASGYVVLCCGTSLAAAALALGAIVQPEWHNIDVGTYHVRRGFFAECRVYSPSRTDCQSLTLPKEFCGHKGEVIGHRHGWSAFFAILSLLCHLGAALLPLAGWCTYTLLTIPSLALSLTAVMCMCITISIFVNTYDEWYYCGHEYCNYANFYLGVGEDCFSRRGESFTLAILSVVGGLLSAFVSALLVRAARASRIDDQGNAIPSKALVAAIHAREASKRRPPTSLSSAERGVSLDSSGAVPPQQEAYKALPGDGGMETAEGVDTAHAPAPIPGSPTPPVTRPRSPPPGETPPPAPAGDWIWNPDSRLYWSAKEYLYLDPFLRQYYDPNTEKWYDPETDTWS